MKSNRTYVLQRIILYGLCKKRNGLMSYSSIRSLKNTMEENKRHGIQVVKEPEKFVKILFITEKAWSKVGNLKNIQAKLTNIKVTSTLIHLTHPLDIGVLRPKAFSIIWNIPCRLPHTIKVQFAPCHNPLTRNVIIIFR